MRAALLFIARAPLARPYPEPTVDGEPWPEAVGTTLLRWLLRALFYGSIAVLPLALVWPWLAAPFLLWAALTVWQVGR